MGDSIADDIIAREKPYTDDAWDRGWNAGISRAADIAAAREAELRAEVERLKSAMDEGNAAYVAVYDDRDRLRALLDEARGAFEKLNVGEGWAAQVARATLAKIGDTHD
jgi:hypothetical protein